jgi:hypothetical protein
MGTQQKYLAIRLFAVIVVHPCGDDAVKFYDYCVGHGMAPVDFVSF